MIEKCIICNGKGKVQFFNQENNKWEDSNDRCEYCQGKGVRYYEAYDSGMIKQKYYKDTEN